MLDTRGGRKGLLWDDKTGVFPRQVAEIAWTREEAGGANRGRER